jgi:hypothetical protein
MKCPGSPSLLTKSFNELPPAAIAFFKINLTAAANREHCGRVNLPAAFAG